MNPNQNLDPGDAERQAFEELVLNARNGDDTAVDELIERYRQYLLLIANKDIEPNLQAKVGSSDIVQESIFKAHQHFGQFIGGSEGEFKGWLKTILLNDIRQNRRRYGAQKRNMRNEINLHDPAGNARPFADEHLTPSSEAIHAEKAKFLDSALHQLTRDQREIIELRHFEHLSFVEIGRRTNRSSDAARKLWARAIEALRIVMMKEQPELITGQQQAVNDHDQN